MSYLEVFVVRPNGDVVKYGEAHNAWGGAMHIWEKLDKQYQTNCPILNYRQLWNSIGRMSEPDKWVLASTYDNVLIQDEHLPTLIKHLTAFVECYPSSTLVEAIDLLERASEDNEAQAVGFNQTSVNSDVWRVYIPPEDEEEEDGETRPYNIYKDTGHWYLTPEYVQPRK